MINKSAVWLWLFAWATSMGVTCPASAGEIDLLSASESVLGEPPDFADVPPAPLSSPTISIDEFNSLKKRLDSLEKDRAKASAPKKEDDWKDMSSEKWTVKL